MKDVIENYAEPVPLDEINLDNGQVYYIPHTSVYHSKKKKIRVVFDCAAKYKDVCINDYYVTGWKSVDFWKEVDQTKIYSKTCKDIVQDNKANGGHPNQRGHELIADELIDWIRSER